jgi:hypothetical protein
MKSILLEDWQIRLSTLSYNIKIADVYNIKIADVYIIIYSKIIIKIIINIKNDVTNYNYMYKKFFME